MAYPDHWLLTFGGPRGTSGETWSCGIRMSVTETDLFGTVNEEDYLTNQAVPALTAWFANTNAKFHTSVKINLVKFNRINGAGNYVDTANTHERILTTPIAGANSANPLPYQVAVCLSWESLDRSRGPASKGRIYAPCTAGLSINPDTGLLISSDTLAMANAGATFLTSLDATLGMPGASKLRPSIVSDQGLASQIDFIRIDTRLDTQRRRSAQLTPTSSRVPLSY